MTGSTRDRLLAAATDLFAERGYRGASVRAICDRARANPGAVSYHFGGKHQLYRSVLRGAASRLAGLFPPLPSPADASHSESTRALAAAVVATLHRLAADPAPTRLLLRDLAGNGQVALEALAPLVRATRARLAGAFSLGDERGGELDLVLVELGATLFLLTAASPLLEQALDLDSGRRDRLAESLVYRSLARSGPPG